MKLLTTLLLAFTGLGSVTSSPVPTGPTQRGPAQRGPAQRGSTSTDTNLTDNTPRSSVPASLGAGPFIAHAHSYLAWDPPDSYGNQRRKKFWEDLCDKALVEHNCTHGKIMKGMVQPSVHNPVSDRVRGVYLKVLGANSNTKDDAKELKVFWDGSSDEGWSSRDRMLMKQVFRMHAMKYPKRKKPMDVSGETSSKTVAPLVFRTPVRAPIDQDGKRLKIDPVDGKRKGNVAITGILESSSNTQAPTQASTHMHPGRLTGASTGTQGLAVDTGRVQVHGGGEYRHSDAQTRSDLGRFLSLDPAGHSGESLEANLGSSANLSAPVGVHRLVAAASQPYSGQQNMHVPDEGQDQNFNTRYLPAHGHGGANYHQSNSFPEGSLDHFPSLGAAGQAQADREGTSSTGIQGRAGYYRTRDGEVISFRDFFG